MEPSVTRRNALERRADRGMRAYVTDGRPVTTTTRAKRHACALRPHATSCGRARWLAAHSRREGLRAHTACWRRSRGLARMKASDACDVLQAPRLLRWQRSRQWWRDGRRRFDGTRERNSVRTDSRATPTTLRLHRDVSILRRAQDRYVAKNAFASATEATDNVAWSLSKNQALISSMITWPPLAGCLLTGRRKRDPH